MEHKNFGTPTTNRGVQNTTGPNVRGFFKTENQYILIDWIQCTIMNYTDTVFSLFRYLFNIAPQLIIKEPCHLFGYDTSYSFKNIKILIAEYREREGMNSMGIHLYVTGTGCRDIEDLNISYFDLFDKLRKLGASFTRLDVSIDSYDDRFYTMNRIQTCIKNGEVRTRFKNSIEFVKTKLDNGENNGLTIWFGSRASNVQIVFYDKLKERQSQNYIISNDIDYWTRLECRFRNEHATEVIQNFLKQSNFNDYLKGIITYNLDFVIFNPSDKNKSRWQQYSWWSDFIGSINRIKFQTVNVEKSITKSRRWINESVSRTNFKVFLSEIKDISVDSISSDFIFDVLTNGAKRLEDSDLQMINDYRVKHNLKPIERAEIEDLIRDIKDVIIERNNNIITV